MSMSHTSLAKRRARSFRAAALGVIGPALMVAPITGGTSLQRGESVTSAWDNTAKLLRRATRKVGHDIKAPR